MFKIKKFLKLNKLELNHASSDFTDSTSARISLFEEYARAKDAVTMFNLTSRLPNPDIILRKTGKGLSALRELKSNYQVGTCIESRKAGVTSKKWRLNKQNSNDKIYSIFDEIFKNIDVHKLIEDILEAPLFGFAPIEISYEKREGYIYPTELTAKPQEWFYFTWDGKFYFNSVKNPILIEKDSPKFLLPRHRSDFLNPYGECLLSRCFWNVLFINGGMEFWLKFMEKYGTPWAIGKYDRSMNEGEQLQLFNTLKRMVQDAVATIPQDGSIELINAGDKSGSNDVYKTFITKCENNISKVILGQTLTTDVGSSGSYAAANIHNQVRDDLVQNDIRLVENTINEFIKKVAGLNFTEKDLPTFEFYEDEGIDQSVAERDVKVYQLGVRFTKEYFKKTYGYGDDDFSVGWSLGEAERTHNVERNVEFSDQPKIAKGGIGGVDFSDSIDNDFDKLENLVTDLNLDEAVIKDSLKPIVELFKTSRDAEACMEELAEIYPEMRTDELEKMLTKVIFLAELQGRIE